jgi:GxxExxY protein
VLSIARSSLPQSHSLKISTNELTGRIIQAAIIVHRRLGPGLLESAYEACLSHELEMAGLGLVRQKAVPVVYGGVKLDCGFRADLVVDNRVAVELKCKEELHPVDFAQLLSHLRLLDLRVGLLINFHTVLLKEGIHRLVNNYQPEEENAETAENGRGER